ncbi:DUF4959 domain-containing protein [Candidatus Symbiothrix dinenymphae]|uniref:DUF4959 domain-containing protein n=1 Tax=Candidatus Symbiothrix dinenymphae TaxID=467085 RepID=UPI0006C6AC03|nr:DUF4959 domain-containing protein [Candidatus Symbiothrix dinenymphae]GAP72990.1 hypothetical protein SAMD00024442_53_4 [Candidatus Symbiothrix dinenymphae]
MNNFGKIAILLLLVVAGFYACQEVERFAISSDDAIPPGKPVLDSVHPLPGGATLFFTIPRDEDVISIEASYEGKNGTVIAAVSIYADSLNVFGMSDTTEHSVEFYAKDRAGNKSEIVPVSIIPKTPAFQRVSNSLKVKPAFSALQVEWDNDLGQSINVYFNLTYNLNGAPISVRRAISSKKLFDRQFIKGLELSETEPVSVSYSIKDAYGNESETVSVGQLYVVRDVLLDKTKWVLPESGTEIGRDTAGNRPVYQSGGAFEGRIDKVIDDIIENDGSRIVSNFAFFGGPFYVTVPSLGSINVNSNPLWNVIIDLGDYYELSRIVTHQRWTYGQIIADLDPNNRGRLYGAENVGIYEVFYLDETTDEWMLINQTKIPKPLDNMSDRDVVFQAAKGDEAFMYPDEPKYTPKTRYFRYRPIAGFLDDYAVANNCWALGEITLYGRKAQ